MSYKNKAIIFLTSVSIAFGQEVNLSPLGWGEGEIEKYLKMDKLPSLWGMELTKFINMYYGK